MAAGPKRQKVSPRDARGFARHPKTAPPMNNIVKANNMNGMDKHDAS